MPGYKGPLGEIFHRLADALEELDDRGEAMAALHLAMAMDCLRASIDPAALNDLRRSATKPQLRLIASS